MMSSKEWKKANTSSWKSFWLMISLAWLVSPYLSHLTHKTVVAVHLQSTYMYIKYDPVAAPWCWKKPLDFDTHKNLYLLAVCNLFVWGYCFSDFNGKFISIKARRLICNLLILSITFLSNRKFRNWIERYYEKAV